MNIDPYLLKLFVHSLVIEIHHINKKNPTLLLGISFDWYP